MPSGRAVALAVLVASSFLAPFMISAVNIALPLIGAEFGADAVTLNWVATAYLASVAALLVPFGRLADIRGRKAVFAVGAAVFGAGSVASALAMSAEALVAARLVQGVGGAMLFSTSVAILSSVFEPGERGKAFGLIVMGVYAGLTLGPLAGGYLTETLGWRSIFALAAPLSFAIAALAEAGLKGEWAEARDETFDAVGAALYCAAIAAAIYGASEPTSAGPLIAAAAAAFIAFLLRESRVEHPLLDTTLFKRNAMFTLTITVALLNYASTFATGFLLSLYLQYVKGLAPQAAGAILMAQPALMALLSPAAGWLSDRVDAVAVVSAGLSLTAIALASLAGLSEATSIEAVMLSLVVLGIGFALFTSPNTNVAMGSVQRRFYGVASAALATMRTLGQTLSMAIAMAVFSTYVGRVEITPEIHSLLVEATRACFALFAAVSLCALAASVLRFKVRGAQEGPKKGFGASLPKLLMW